MKKSFSLLASVLMLMSCGSSVTPVQSDGESGLEFSFDFFRNVLEKSGEDTNVSVSPYSAGVALSMLQEGAAGETREELHNALGGFLFKNEDLGGSDTVVISSANSVWIDEGFTVKKSYVEHLSADYQAQAFTQDFADPATLQAVNGWCSEHTSGRIDEILKELTPDMVMILANALYFKASWLDEFPSYNTRDGVFHGSEGDETVPFMSQKREFDYAEYAGNQIIKLPYEGGRYSMYILLPSESLDVVAAGRYLTAYGVRQVMPMLKKTLVDIKLPKFRIESDMGLIPVLESMGVKAAFTSSADFSGMSRASLAVSEVIQKTFIEVGEKGTEAAAVTAAVMKLTSARPVPVLKMIVDRPFYYMIADMETENILFAGRVMNL